MSGEIGAPEAERGTLRISNVGREEEVAIRGKGLNQRRIHLPTAYWNLGNTSLPQILQRLLRPLVVYRWVNRLQHLDQLVISNTLCHRRSQRRINLGKLVKVKPLEKRAVLSLPPNVGDSNATLKQMVARSLHLLLEAGNVAADHPLQERADNTGTAHVPHLHRVSADVCPLHGRHQQRDIAVDALINDVRLRVRRALPREGIRAMLAKIPSLTRPDVVAVIVALAALLEVGL